MLMKLLTHFKITFSLFIHHHRNANSYAWHIDDRPTVVLMDTLSTKHWQPIRIRPNCSTRAFNNGRQYCEKLTVEVGVDANIVIVLVLVLGVNRPLRQWHCVSTVNEICFHLWMSGVWLCSLAVLTCPTTTVTSVKRMAVRTSSMWWRPLSTTTPTPGCGPSAAGNTSQSSSSMWQPMFYLFNKHMIRKCLDSWRHMPMQGWLGRYPINLDV